MDVEAFVYSSKKVQPSIVVGDGQSPEMHQVPSQYVHILYICTPRNSHPLALLLFLKLFGGSAFAKDLMGITDYHRATWTQNFIASVAGAVASITVAAPLDTIKTRIQNANFEQNVRGWVVVKDLLKNEGSGALFKGLTPKVCDMSFFWICSSGAVLTDGLSFFLPCEI